jgi:hypothetical protein
MAPGAIPVLFLRLERWGFIGIGVAFGLGLRLILRRASCIRCKRSRWRMFNLLNRAFMALNLSVMSLQLSVTIDPIKERGGGAVRHRTGIPRVE